MIGWVGNGDGVIVMGMNVDVGMNVGETTVGMDVSGGKAAASFPQAVRKAITTIQIIFSFCFIIEVYLCFPNQVSSVK